jgi:hypothetical protein
MTPGTCTAAALRGGHEKQPDTRDSFVSIGPEQILAFKPRIVPKAGLPTICGRVKTPFASVAKDVLQTEPVRISLCHCLLLSVINRLPLPAICAGTVE